MEKVYLSQEEVKKLDLSKMEFFTKSGKKFDLYKPYPIEKKILPLVNALNETKLFKTFSSCQGHFYAREQNISDRNFADVRFVAIPKAPMSKIEELLRFINTEYYQIDPSYVLVEAFKRFMGPVEFFDSGKFKDLYLIKITPYNRFDKPGLKRKYTDTAINEVTRLIKVFMKQEKTMGRR